MDWLNNDRELLARTLTAEAGNQGVPGLLAAGSVIMNRVKQGGYGDGVRGVILKPGQFSPLNSLTFHADGEQGRDMAAIRPTSEAYSVADTLLSGDYTDPTGGATHFYNPDISSPSWGGGEGWTRIGAHVFGKADAGRSGGMAPQQRPTGPTISTSGAAPQMQAAPQADQPFWKDLDFWDRLAVALSGMSLNPNQALIQTSAQRIQDRSKTRQTEKRKNQTVEALRKVGAPPQLIQLAEAGYGKEAISQAMQMMQPQKQEETAAMRNYQFLVSRGVDPEEARSQAFGKGGTTINLPGQPMIGNIPEGYQAIQDPETLVYRYEPVRGGPVADEMRAAQERQENAATQQGIKETVIARDVDRLVGMIDKGGMFNLPETGIMGGAMANLGINQEAVDFANTLKSIQATVAFDTLQKMREASKTGGALGAVSERELDLLISAMGALQQNTSPEVLRDNLIEVKRIMTKIENDPVARSFYYGGQGGSVPQNSGGDFEMIRRVK